MHAALPMKDTTRTGMETILTRQQNEEMKRGQRKKARVSDSKPSLLPRPFLYSLAVFLLKTGHGGNEVPARLARQATAYHLLSGTGKAECLCLHGEAILLGIRGAKCWLCLSLPSVE